MMICVYAYQLRLHGVQLLSRVLQFVPDASVPFQSADDTNDEALPSFNGKYSGIVEQ